MVKNIGKRGQKDSDVRRNVQNQDALGGGGDSEYIYTVTGISPDRFSLRKDLSWSLYISIYMYYIRSICITFLEKPQQRPFLVNYKHLKKTQIVFIKKRRLFL